MSDFHPDGRRRTTKRTASDNAELPLFDFAEAPVETRKAAFIASKIKLSERCKIVLRFIRERGDYGATMHEASVETGILYQSICGVFVTLKRRKLTRHNDEKRPTSTGSLAAVIVARNVFGPDPLTEGEHDADV